MSTASFVHLRIHSEFSLVDGIVRIPELLAAVRQADMPAVAITDLSNVFAAVKFYRQAMKGGIKPLLGADLWLENPGNAAAPWRMTLLCQDRVGFRNLSRLLTRAYLENQQAGRPCVKEAWFGDHGDRLIALAGGAAGPVGHALLGGHGARARRLAEGFARQFPERFYLDLQRTGQPDEEHYIAGAVDVAAQLGLPVVATNDVHFLRAEEFEAHEVRVCIQDGRVLNDRRRPRRFTGQEFLRTPAQMTALFADIPEALANSVEIALRCNLELQTGVSFLPEFPVTGERTVTQVLSDQAREGLDRRLAKADTLSGGCAAYQDRLRDELGVIVSMGFAGYFLIVADFIQWAKDQQIPVGPGRGSGAGSVVAWALGITELDPIRFGLLFERFLNPERVSLPDLDIDFCIEGRDRVIEYVTELYGRDRVAQIITHGTMAARAAVRDVGRVLGKPYGFVDGVAKLIPFDPGIKLDKALESEERLRERYENEGDVRELLDTARTLEGLARNAGKHAGGVVIAPSPLTDFTPLYAEQGATQAVTQLDKTDLEAIGLVKFDFLGLRTLTIIDKAVAMVNEERRASGEEPLDIKRLPMDDAQTFALLKSCRTTALFQLESRGMRDLILRMQPDTFEDIVAVVALFRPGPLQSGMIEEFVKRKQGRAAIAYPHPALEEILRPTYGVILYQEQVMQISQTLAGYSLGAADLLRRAIGEKNMEAMARQRSIFVNGALERQVSERQATYIYDLIEKFGEYGFNKSHSAAYALIAYQTAWLKTHYPATFMAAALSADMEHTDKVMTLIAACREIDVPVLAPDVNRCVYHFRPQGQDAILYGLGAVKGVGRTAIEHLVQERVAHGAFADLASLCNRLDLKKINRRMLESLICAGAMEVFGQHRAQLLSDLKPALDGALQRNKDRELGQSDLFGVAVTPVREQRHSRIAPWPEAERLTREREALGLYLTGHPIDRLAGELVEFTDATIRELKPVDSHTVVVAGLVTGLRTANTRRGGRMAFVTLDDGSGRLELAVFSELYARAGDRLVKDAIIVVEGQVSVDEYTGGFRMSAENLYNMDEARAAFVGRLVIDVEEGVADTGFVNGLHQVLEQYKGGECPVVLRYRQRGAQADVRLGEDWRIRPTTSALDALRAIAGKEHVHVQYRREASRRAAPGAPASRAS